MFSEKNIPKLIILTPIVTVILVAFFTIYFFIQNQNNYFEEESIRVEKEYLERQKNILKKEVDYIINYIEYHVNRNSKLTKEELQNEILRYTETIRYGIHGYIWIHDTNYYLKSHPFRQESLNSYDIDLKEQKIKFTEDIYFNTIKRELYFKNEIVSLRKRDKEFLLLLYENKHRILTYEMIEEYI